MTTLDLSQTCKCHIFSKGKKAEKENSKATNGGSKANSNLHSSALEPGTGDVLWAPGLIRVSRSMLDPKRASVTAPASKTLSKQCVRCETCKVGVRFRGKFKIPTILFPYAAGINWTRGVDAFGAAVVVRHPGGVKAAWR